MTQGIFINGSRPKTKKQLKDIITRINDPEEDHVDGYSVVIEATSLFGNEFDGSLAKALKEGQYGPFYLVGPDPYSDRRWFANLRYHPDKKIWKVQ